MKDHPRARKFIREERINSVTHGVGLALSVIGFFVLITLSYLHGTAWHIASCSIFGAALIILYTASTLYHSIQRSRIKQLLKIFDHSAIYLLIAGTYTPFTIILLGGRWGWGLFALVWGLAVAGIIFKVFFVNSFKVGSTLVYVAMGWSVLIAIKPFVTQVPLGAIIWLLAGGLFYSSGVFFFACRKVPYNHAIWHVFVLAGSICHYLAVVLYVVPLSA